MAVKNLKKNDEVYIKVKVLDLGRTHSELEIADCCVHIETGTVLAYAFTEEDLYVELEKRRKERSLEDKISIMIKELNSTKSLLPTKKIELELDESNINKIEYFILQKNEMSPRMRKIHNERFNKIESLNEDNLDLQEKLLEKDSLISNLNLELFRVKRELEEFQEERDKNHFEIIVPEKED